MAAAPKAGTVASRIQTFNTRSAVAQAEAAKLYVPKGSQPQTPTDRPTTPTISAVPTFRLTSASTAPTQPSSPVVNATKPDLPVPVEDKPSPISSVVKEGNPSVASFTPSALPSTPAPAPDTVPIPTDFSTTATQSIPDISSPSQPRAFVPTIASAPPTLKVEDPTAANPTYAAALDAVSNAYTGHGGLGRQETQRIQSPADVRTECAHEHRSHHHRRALSEDTGIVDDTPRRDNKVFSESDSASLRLKFRRLDRDGRTLDRSNPSTRTISPDDAMTASPDRQAPYVESQLELGVYALAHPQATLTLKITNMPAVSVQIIPSTMSQPDIMVQSQPSLVMQPNTMIESNTMTQPTRPQSHGNLSGSTYELLSHLEQTPDRNIALVQAANALTLPAEGARLSAPPSVAVALVQPAARSSAAPGTGPPSSIRGSPMIISGNNTSPPAISAAAEPHAIQDSEFDKISQMLDGIVLEHRNALEEITTKLARELSRLQSDYDSAPGLDGTDHEDFPEPHRSIAGMTPVLLGAMDNFADLLDLVHDTATKWQVDLWAYSWMTAKEAHTDQRKRAAKLPGQRVARPSRLRTEKRGQRKVKNPWQESCDYKRDWSSPSEQVYVALPFQAVEFVPVQTWISTRRTCCSELNFGTRHVKEESEIYGGLLNHYSD